MTAAAAPPVMTTIDARRAVTRSSYPDMPEGTEPPRAIRNPNGPAHAPANTRRSRVRRTGRSSRPWLDAHRGITHGEPYPPPGYEQPCRLVPPQYVRFTHMPIRGCYLCAIYIPPCMLAFVNIRQARTSDPTPGTPKSKGIVVEKTLVSPRFLEECNIV